ncbi:MAG TPA: type I restriction endonuclease, partial [Candidatus Paceibacterota bacterium]|nr:type I restriction endonuclease [Candidatus Paceibacterota bacterium]
MSMLSEKNAVEDPVFEWLEKLGWELEDESEIRKYNRPLSEPIIKQIFLKKVSEINEISEEDAKKAYDILIQQFSKPDLLNANETFLNRVNNGININIEGRDITLRIINFENIWENSFIATKQYWVQHKKPDIVLLINGIPFVCIEAKQRARRSTNWLEGVKQFKTYNIESPKLFVTNCFGVVCNGKLARYGIPGVSSE